jgi:WD40 repeat protein
MTATQERAVAAMRAIGDTVTGAPPLRLPPHTAASTRFTRLPGPTGSGWRAWRLWLVPAAAAVAVVALGVSLALVRSAPKESALLPGTASASAGAGGSASVPPYYVMLAAFGWYAYAPLTGQASPTTQTAILVGETATGKSLATVTPPHGMTFNVVRGAADDRTFVVGATSYSPGEKTVSTIWSETWYLLRISPGTSHVARLTRLPVPSVQDVTGVALSPDGTEVAVASKQFNVLGGSSASDPPQLSLWSVATGKPLRHWAAQTGWITASTPAAGSRPGQFDTTGMATGLRWTPDGGELAFAWNGSEIRLLDLSTQASRQSDLGKASRYLAGIGTSYTPDGASFTCVAAHGWSLSSGAKTFTCAGSYTPARAATGPGCGKDAPAHPAFFQVIALGGGAQELTTLAPSPYCTGTGPRTQGAGLGWSSADGSKIIGTLSNGPLVQDIKFGIFTKKTFTALPGLLPAGSAASVAW